MLNDSQCHIIIITMLFSWLSAFCFIVWKGKFVGGYFRLVLPMPIDWIFSCHIHMYSIRIYTILCGVCIVNCIVPTHIPYIVATAFKNLIIGLKIMIKILFCPHLIGLMNSATYFYYCTSKCVCWQNLRPATAGVHNNSIMLIFFEWIFFY